MQRTTWLLFVSLLAFACASGRGAPAAIEVESREGPAPWSRLEIGEGARDFRFVVVGDRTGGHREGVFGRALDAANLLHPAFVLSVGDLIEGNTEDGERLDAMWSEFEALVARLAMPFFHVPGNHDYGNAVMARAWQQRFGPSFYSFRHRDALFLVLNSELISSFVSRDRPIEGGESEEQQLHFVERVLDEHADARWTFVLLHQPLWETPAGHEGWERIEARLGERPYTVFAGHFHSYMKRSRNDREYLTLATSGGASRLRGVERGEFDHITLVTMRDEGPLIANLLLDGIHDTDVHDEAARELIRHLDRVVTTLPLVLEEETLSSAEQRFALHNGADRPVTARARFDASPHFSVSPRRVERVLAPGASESVSVTLRATAPRRVAEVTPGLAHWSVEALGAQRTVRVEEVAWLIPERRFPIPRARGSVTVDGDLGDWPPLRLALEDWPEEDGGRADASLRFDVRADDDFLYLAFEVSDATPVFSEALGVQKQDGITLEIDARPDPERSRNLAFREAIADGTLAKLLITTLAPVAGTPAPVLERFAAPLPEGLRRAARQHAGGYSVELAVPSAYLDERAGGSWRGVRINLVLQDFASEGGAGREYDWRPLRYEMPGHVIEGAGTFVRE